MISAAEIERYEKFALVCSGRKTGSPDEQNLAMMVINLIAVIDHLASTLTPTPAGESGTGDVMNWDTIPLTHARTA